jgi:hypothetical protein
MYYVKVLDPSIKDIVLDDTIMVTFGTIDGRPLLFPSGTQPWRCLLATHSVLAHRHAREKHWQIDDDLTAAELSAAEMMNFALDDDAQMRISMLFDRSCDIE